MSNQLMHIADVKVGTLKGNSRWYPSSTSRAAMEISRVRKLAVMKQAGVKMTSHLLSALRATKVKPHFTRFQSAKTSVKPARPKPLVGPKEAEAMHDFAY